MRPVIKQLESVIKLLKIRDLQYLKERENMEDIVIIRRTIDSIKAPDGEVIRRAKMRQDDLAKPPGSLGKLESIAIRLAGIAGTKAQTGGASDVNKNAGTETPKQMPWNETSFERGCVIVFCADNGVAEQGVASAPQSVTRAQTINFTRRLTGVGALAQSYGSELLIVDVGVKEPIPEELYDQVPFRDTCKIVDRRIRPGTGDISLGPAMSREEAAKAMAVGIEMTAAAVREGYEILGIGEMGIGNTTTSAAVLSSYTGADSGLTCGRGGGVNDRGFTRKGEIIDDASKEARAGGGLLAVWPLQTGMEDGTAASPSETGEERPAKDDTAKHTRLDDVLDVLSRCGGFDICAMTGAYLGAASRGIPVVIDGYISAVAALGAAIICPGAKEYMFASHRSSEPGYSLAIKKLGLEPFLSLDMRLGEGSGCPIAFSVIRGAWDVMKNMATFEEAKIDDGYLEEIRGNSRFR